MSKPFAATQARHNRQTTWMKKTVTVLQAPHSLLLSNQLSQCFDDGFSDSSNALYLVQADKTNLKIYSISRNGTQDKYDVIFQMLKKKDQGLYFKSATTDHEKARENGIEINFPSNNMYACFLHFGHALGEKNTIILLA